MNCLDCVYKKSSNGDDSMQLIECDYPLPNYVKLNGNMIWASQGKKCSLLTTKKDLVDKLK
jgi:hypothetical protein